LQDVRVDSLNDGCIFSAGLLPSLSPQRIVNEDLARKALTFMRGEMDTIRKADAYLEFIGYDQLEEVLSIKTPFFGFPNIFESP
jgi:hypothetical protein